MKRKEGEVEPGPAGGGPQLGCERCRSVPASQKDSSIRPVRTLWDSSHSSFELCRCSDCGQAFLQQFHEIVNWSGGEDDVWIRWMPLTTDENGEVEAMCRADQGPRPYGVWDRLAEPMHRRGRLVRNPDGRIYWSDWPWDAGDMMLPG